jgi:hypothetical protein
MTSSNTIRKWASQYGSYTPSTDVPNLTSWWRADTKTIGTGVSQLTDKKGSVNLTQATGSKQPTFNAADANMGGRDSITFDGIDDALTVASPGIGAMSAITIFFVTRSMATPGVTAQPLSIGNSSDAQSVRITQGVTANLSVLYSNPAATNSAWVMTATQADQAANAPRIYSWSGTLANGGATVWDGRGRLGLVGAAGTNASTGSTLANQQMCLGAAKAGTSAYAAFTFGELMICNAALTSEQMLAVNMYLAGYYGVLN